MFRSLLVGTAAVLALGAALLRGQAPDGAALFAKHCAMCHDGAGAERAPSREALRDRTPQDVLTVLTSGLMASQAAALTEMERRTLAEYLTGRALETRQSDGPARPKGGTGQSDVLSPEELKAQTGAAREIPITFVPVPQVDRATSRDWPLHNFDLANSRYAPLGQINSSNVKSIAVKWLYHTRNSASTPIVVDGIMYVTSADGVVALDAANGRPVWQNLEASSNKGAAYGDGKIYVARDARLWALDARTGKLVESFGDKGVSHALADVLTAKFPQLKKPADWGYSYNMAPQYHAGIVIVATALSENHIPGGAVLAVDGKTGKLLWKFWTVPQSLEDEGWEIAKDTWVGGVRHGGGVWATPAIDPESGTLHMTIANPSPDQDGSARKGINLFTNAFVAPRPQDREDQVVLPADSPRSLGLRCGAAADALRHSHGGRTIKAIAAANKNGYVYILNRETGQPINPIVETAVPTRTEVPGEEPWPTQPIPHTLSGRLMVPTASQFPETVFPRYASYPRMPLYTPPTLNGAVHAPREAVHYGGSSFNPEMKLLFVAGKEWPMFLTAIPVGATMKVNQFSTAGKRESAGPETGNVSAYDPATGELVWRTPIGGGPSAGTTATAGNSCSSATGKGPYTRSTRRPARCCGTSIPGPGSARRRSPIR